MTKNRLLALLVLCMGVGLLAQAAPITQQQAQQEAAKFLLNKQKNSSNIVLASKANKKSNAATTAAFYVFNVGNQQGWVIVSGDDRTNPILGFSDEGYFDEARIPANMKAWLDEYALQITQIDDVAPADLKKALAAPKAVNVVDTRNSIAPMITTKWDQATPYWNECPQFMNGDTEEDGYELAYTGCVATSMSQLMKYYNYPEQTTQVIPSYTFTYSDGNYNYTTVQMEELPITTFDWAHMKDTYTGAEDEVYTSAVAHLMYYVGCAVKSQYGVSSTGAYTDDIPRGFELFGYGSKLAYRNDYTQEVWDEMVYQELAAGRPMIYNGTAGSGGGHSFVCDGYEYGNYFHINWGWGGMGNGYFQLAVMNPYASGIGGSSSAEGYNMKQNIVYNVIPGGASPGSGDEEDPVLTCTAVSGPSGWDRDGLSYPFKIHKSKIVKVSYSDHANSGKKFKTALALYDPNTDSFTICENSEGNGYFTVTTSALGETRQFGSGIMSNASNVIKFGAGLTGTYHLVGAYQLEGTSEWKLMKESDRHYLEVVMTNYSATSSEHPIINLQTTNWEFTGGERVGVREQVNVTVKNNSVDRFFGDLYLDFGGQQIDEYSQYTTVVTGEVMPGEEKVITFNVTPTSSGTKTVKLMRLDSYGSLITIGTGSVTIAQSSEAQELNLSVVIQAENATTQPSGSNIFGEIYDSHARFSATITNHSNGDYSKYVLAPLFIIIKNDDGTVAGGSMVTYKQSALSLAAGESKTLYFDFDNLAYGSTYAMNIYARNYVPDNEEGTHLENIVQPGQSVYYDILPGVITWTAEGVRTGYQPVEGFQVAANVAAVSLEGLTLSNIVPNSNPNTLYFIDEGTSAPSSLNGLNVVAGASASNIALTDGYPYFTPQSFTAQTISYSRTFDKARQDGVAENWSTIVLPFTPATCSASNSDMWIERFAQEEDGVVKFEEVQGIEANVPYIIAINKNANLTGTPITWSASDVLLKPEPIAYTSGEAYLMAGTFVEQNLEDIYNVNAAGALAQWGNGTVSPFRAFFKELIGLDNHVDILLPGEAQQSIPGDVNGDGSVTSADITALYSFILSGDLSDIVNGDQDGDGNITSSDVTTVYSILLGV
ncbi:MAG: C10 family peptidase [Muribaculaceae bacterium]|nr:C10 family peptidase [Muribaculaceae bacterium]